jgi:exodeoxyribonuclease-5
MKKQSSSFRFKYVPRPPTEESILAAANRDMGGCLTENSLSSDQVDVFRQICLWFESHRKGRGGPQILTVGGYAGTGKSTLISVLAGKYNSERLGFCAFTGKATSVLRKKFFDANVSLGSHEIKTLHSLMYFPIVDEETGGVRGWRRRDELEFDLLIVDEASMIDAGLLEDLQSYGIPILAVGDHGQLPPVFGTLSLMEKPNLRLEKIHRQAEDSPILALSEFVRRTGQLPRFKDPSLEVQLLDVDQIDDVIDSLYRTPDIRYNDVGMLCYTNAERISLNHAARQARWQANDEDLEKPRVGDGIICLKNTENTIFNGMRGALTQFRPSSLLHYEGAVLFEEDEISVEGSICAMQFDRETTFKNFDEVESVTGSRPRDWETVGLLMDYGYAMTIHKAQGSEWEHVIVSSRFPMRIDLDTKKRALYTAVTRCTKYLVVLE